MTPKRPTRGDREVAIQTFSESRPPAREYVDSQGTRWRVSEIDAARVPGARGPHCLIFASVHTIRRVWNYPQDWSQGSAADLDALSWRR